MQKTITIIVFMVTIAVIRAQGNTNAVEDPSENEANDLSILNNYNKFIKTLIKYGVPFYEGNTPREKIMDHFGENSNKDRQQHLEHYTAVNSAKENRPNDEVEHKKRLSIMSYYKKYIENLIKYGIKIRNPQNERYEYTTSKGRAQYIDRNTSIKIEEENGSDSYNKYLNSYEIPKRNPNKERYTTSKGRPLYIAEYSTSKGRAQYLERDKN